MVYFVPFWIGLALKGFCTKQFLIDILMIPSVENRKSPMFEFLQLKIV